MKLKSRKKSLGEIHDDSSLVSKAEVDELAKAVFVTYKVSPLMYLISVEYMCKSDSEVNEVAKVVIITYH